MQEAQIRTEQGLGISENEFTGKKQLEQRKRNKKWVKGVEKKSKCFIILGYSAI